MRLLQINCVFAAGSTGKIVYAIHEYVKSHGDESYVIYGMGKRINDLNVFRTTPWFVRKAQSLRARITGFPYGGCLWGTAKAINLIKKVKPDVVHIQCMNSYMVNIYRVMEYLKNHGFPTVITNHAEFMYTGGCTHTVNCEKWLTGCHDCDKIGKEHPISYFFDRTKQEWEMMKAAYAGFDKLTICCVSDWVRNRACQSPFYRGHPVITVLNGLDTDIFHYQDTSVLRKQLGLENKKIVVHVTPNFYSIIKGGKHVIEMAKRFPDVEFIILGSESKDDTVPKNCRFMGKITDQKLLAQYYSLGDVCLLTSVRETFSMVCAESLCCGTPVVGFKAGGPETIALPGYSTFVDQSDDDCLENELKYMINQKYDKSAISSIAVDQYGQETMCKNYYKVYTELLR